MFVPHHPLPTSAVRYRLSAFAAVITAGAASNAPAAARSPEPRLADQWGSL